MLAVIVGFWVSRHGREWVGGFGVKLSIKGLIHPTFRRRKRWRSKYKWIASPRRLAKARFPNEQAKAIFREVGEIAVMPLFVVMAGRTKLLRPFEVER